LIVGFEIVTATRGKILT